MSDQPCRVQGKCSAAAAIVLMAAVCAGKADPVAPMPGAERLFPAAIFDEDKRQILGELLKKKPSELSDLEKAIVATAGRTGFISCPNGVGTNGKLAC